MAGNSAKPRSSAPRSGSHNRSSRTDESLRTGRPGLIIAGRFRATAAAHSRTSRAVGCRRTGQVRLVRLLPFARYIILFGRRYVHGVVDPAMPVRRDRAGFGIAVVNHPAALEAQRRIDLAALGAVIFVALLVGTDQFAESRRPQVRPEGRPAPPREEFQQKLFHILNRSKVLSGC